jgi:MFS family permease
VRADEAVGTVELSDAERARLQRRTIRTLIAGQVLGSAGLTSGLTVGGLIVEDMLGGDTLAGIGTAAITMGTAFGSAHLSRTMAWRGRRPGLARGYAIGALGALVAIVGVQAGMLPVFVAGMLLYGHGQSSNLLARYAAADLATTADRGRAISTLVFASTFGAVAGPVLVGAGKRLGDAVGIDELAGPYLFAILFFALAAANVTARLRPDPLVVSGGTRPRVRGERDRIQIREPLRIVNADALARLALVAMVISQSVMVAVMTMTPLHMKDHGHSVELVGAVLAVHIAGMYAFAPIVGRASDRYGRLSTLAAGAGVLIAATVVTALAGEAPPLLFAGLFLLGVAWSIGLVAGSALLADRITGDERVRVQGVADLCMSAFGGLAGFASGFVKHAAGFHTLANLGTLAAGLLLVGAVAQRRRATPAPVA